MRRLIALTMFAALAAAPGPVAADLPDDSMIPGVVRPLRWVRVSSETDGRVVEKAVEEHRNVAAGATVLRVDDRLKVAAVTMARAGLLEASARRDLARADLERARTLIERDASSTAELERAVAAEKSAEAAVLTAEANLAVAEFHLEKTRIVSPISGVVSRIDIERDELLRPGQFVFSVMDVRNVKVESWVRDEVARTIGTGDVVQLEAGGRTLEAKVRSVASGTDNESRTFKVVLVAENATVARGLLLRPGTTVYWKAPK